MSFTITLSDGSKLENLQGNGNNFVAHYPITEDIFKYKLASIDIEGKDDTGLAIGIETGHFENMQLVTIDHGYSYMEPDEYWFVLAPITEAELRYNEIKSDIDYLAMMTDTEL